MLSQSIAPGLAEMGVMLPYSPLHHLLLNDFGGPLLATSANISGEPVLTDNAEVEQRLAHVAEACLHHDRPIERPADDPVFRSIAGRPRPIRLGRGFAPGELTLPFELEKPLLAVGAHMKNTITLAWNNRAVMSPHIGEMDSARSLAVFEKTIEDLQLLYNVKVEQLVCDAHPGYTTSRWAGKQGLPFTNPFTIVPCLVGIHKCNSQMMKTLPMIPGTVLTMVLMAACGVEALLVCRENGNV